MSRLRAAACLTGFLLLTLPLMPLQQLFLWTSPQMARRFPHYYHRCLARLLGIRVRVRGTPASPRALLMAANHVSYLDIIVMSAVAPLSFIAKREVRRWPLFGQLARLQRTVFIDRDRRHTTAVARDEMNARLADGDTLVLFAEGTSGDGASVLPFKSSFFALADLDHVTVQPVSLVYGGHRNLPMPRHLRPLYAWYGGMDLAPHLWEALATGPIEVDVLLHPPVAGALPRKALARACENAVRHGLVSSLHGRPEMG
jgi:1-acyl-sn-glycerol-3-phosphate acyltransferase